MRIDDTDALLFDLDGTLIDTVDLILRSYRHTVGVHGYTPLSDEEWLKNLGIPLRMQFRHFTQEPDEIQAMISTYIEHNLEHHDALVLEYPGVRDAVASFSEAGYRLAVVTSKMHGSLERGLERGGYDGLFEVLIGADDVVNAKPHPEPVLMALDKLGVAAERAVFLGDSPFDMASGKAAGVRVGAVTWGPFSREELAGSEPDYWLESPTDLQRFLPKSQHFKL